MLTKVLSVPDIWVYDRQMISPGKPEPQTALCISLPCFQLSAPWLLLPATVQVSIARHLFSLPVCLEDGRPQEGMVGLCIEGTWNICNYGLHCCTRYMAERSPVTKTSGRLLTMSTGSKQCALVSPRQSVINSLLLGEFAWHLLLHCKTILALVMAFLVNNAKKPFG